MRKKLFVSLASAAMCAALSQLPVYAATVDEVADAARSYGISEEDIQVGYNEYYAHPEKYPPERLDEVIAKLHETGGTIVSTVPYNPNYVPPTPATTEPATESSQPVNAENTEPPAATATAPSIDNSVELTANDGSKFTRISAEAFIAMTYEEKMAYLSSFPEDRQQIIINNLTPAEYKSLIKQSPADKKMEIVHSLSGAADEMGLSVTVDEVTDDSLTLSMRNDEGTLVNVSSAGASVEDTGYDRRGIFAAAGAFFLTAVAGVIFLAAQCFNKNENEGING